METIPILDLSPDIERHWTNYTEAMQSVLKSGHFILGDNGKSFEKEIAAYLGVKHAIGVNSGTDALVLSLRALGIGAGDEVITTPFTFFATAESISLLGAIPVFVDIDPRTLNIDVTKVEQAITTKTKAIMPVHLFGLAAEMEPLLMLSRERNLPLVEDVAQATGGNYDGKKLGSLGRISAFSFFPSKNLGAFGDGGLVVTNDDTLALECRKLRTHGSIVKYQNEILGYNSRLDEMQAAILRLKLPRLEEANTGRRRAASRYSEVLEGFEGIQTPKDTAKSQHVYHQYTIRIPGGRRDAVAKKLAEQKISTMIYYPTPVHKLPVYAQHNETFAHSEKAAAEVLSLPIWPEISVETQLRVTAAIQKAIKES